MAEHDGEGIARHNLDNGLDYLLKQLNYPEHELWITGKDNFRFQVYPEYKANRLKTPRPKYLEVCREHLLTKYHAHISEGCEADDMLGVIQCQQNEQGIETMISSIDKDLLMIPGWHYSPEIKRKGTIVRPEIKRLVSPLDGLRTFYTQLLVGDPTDNIKGVSGMGKIGAGRALANLETEEELFNVVLDAYGSIEELEMNARVLWIWRKLNDDVTERWKEFGMD